MTVSPGGDSGDGGQNRDQVRDIAGVDFYTPQRTGADSDTVIPPRDKGAQALQQYQDAFVALEATTH